MLGYYKMSLIGSAHKEVPDGVCQDYSDVMTLPNGWIAAVIADGLGSAKHSEVGSKKAVETVLSFVAEHLPEKWHEESLLSLLRVAYHEALKNIAKIAKDAGCDINDYDTTLTALIYNGTNLVYGHVGDGGILALSPYGNFSVVTKAQKGSAFNETFPLRSGPENWSFGTADETACALLMMTDGIYDIAVPWLLARSEQKININYVRGFMDRNILKVSEAADFETVQKEIEEFFTGEYSSGIVDDKTIVGIIDTDVMPEERDEDYYREPDWEALVKAHRESLYAPRVSAEEETPEAENTEPAAKEETPGTENDAPAAEKETSGTKNDAPVVEKDVAEKDVAEKTNVEESASEESSTEEVLKKPNAKKRIIAEKASEEAEPEEPSDKPETPKVPKAPNAPKAHESVLDRIRAALQDIKN